MKVRDNKDVNAALLYIHGFLKNRDSKKKSLTHEYEAMNYWHYLRSNVTEASGEVKKALSFNEACATLAKVIIDYDVTDAMAFIEAAEKWEEEESAIEHARPVQQLINLDESLLLEIAEAIETEWNITGLFEGVHKEFASELLKRYIQEKGA